jgi:hypothetical protein
VAGRVSFEVTPGGLDERLSGREAREVIPNVTCDAGAPRLDLGTEAMASAYHRFVGLSAVPRPPARPMRRALAHSDGSP